MFLIFEKVWYFIVYFKFSLKFEKQSSNRHSLLVILKQSIQNGRCWPSQKTLLTKSNKSIVYCCIKLVNPIPHIMERTVLWTLSSHTCQVINPYALPAISYPTGGIRWPKEGKSTRTRDLPYKARCKVQAMQRNPWDYPAHNSIAYDASR